MRLIPTTAARRWAAAAALAALPLAAPARAQAPTTIPVHAATPLVLDPGVRQYEVPLAFPGFDPAAVERVSGFNATGNALPSTVQVEQQPGAPTTGVHAGRKVAAITVDGANLAPTTIVLDLVGSTGAVLATLRVPLAAPEPTISGVFFGPGAGMPELSLQPLQVVETQVTVRGGPFFPKARIALPAPLEVGPATVSSGGTVLTAVVRQPAQALYQLPVGTVPLSIGNAVGGEAKTMVTLRGPSPDITSAGQITVSGQARETVTLSVSDISDTSRVEIRAGENVSFATISQPLADVSSPTISFEVDLPALAKATGTALVQVVNRDNAMSAPVTLRLLAAPRATLSITGSDKLTPTVPAALTFQAQNDPGVRFTGVATEYMFSVNGKTVELHEPVVDPLQTALRATVELPIDLAPTVDSEVVIPARLRGDGLGEGLNGTITIAALPVIESPQQVTLRPGESRMIPLRGRRLSRMELRGSTNVQVTAQDLKQEIGTASITALRTAQPGTVERVEGFRDVESATMAVRIGSWLDHPVMAAHARYRSGEGEAQPFKTTDTLEVSPGKAMRFSIQEIAGLPAEGELVRAQIVREGTIVWQDSVLVLPGAAGDFRRSFTPGDVFPHGQEFTLTMTGQGGAYVQQRFRTKYERGLICYTCVKVHTGVTAVQVPLGGPARDRYSDGLFTGVTLGLSFPLDEVANYANSDFARLIFLGTISIPPALPVEEEGEAEPVAVGSSPAIGAQQDEDEDEPRQSVVLGLSGGVLLWETLFFTAGWDARGDDFSEGFIFSLGGTVDLSSIPGLLRRQ
jgi:hypothetical protein